MSSRMSCSNCCCGTKAATNKKLDKKLPSKSKNLSTSSSLLTAKSPDQKNRIPTSQSTLTTSENVDNDPETKNQSPTTSSNATSTTKKSSKSFVLICFYSININIDDINQRRPC